MSVRVYAGIATLELGAPAASGPPATLVLDATPAAAFQGKVVAAGAPADLELDGPTAYPHTVAGTPGSFALIGSGSTLAFIAPLDRRNPT
ncbi:MAG: hypothetical protein KDB35_23120 [Acidimicrobiales bacterium]|nr:hypothetical protein [Acidimicrobiales bacterium]